MHNKFNIKRVFIYVIISFVCLVVLTQSAYAENHQNAINLSEAKSFALLDDSGQMLVEYNALAELPMASITKIMTAMVALDQVHDLNVNVPADRVNLPAGAQIAGFTSPQDISFTDIMSVMLVFSANDAAEIVARFAGGSTENFVQLMNNKAQELGLTHTHFTNPTGLEDPQHYSCAHDLVIMGKYARDHYPFIKNTVIKEQVTIPVNGKQTTFYTTDHLMGHYRGLVGIKTGKVESGTTFLGAAKRGDITLYSAVLGCKTDEGRFIDTRHLLDFGFASFTSRQLSTKGNIKTYAKLPYNSLIVFPVIADNSVFAQVYKHAESISHKNYFAYNPYHVQANTVCGYTSYANGLQSFDVTVYSLGKPLFLIGKNAPKLYNINKEAYYENLDS